MSQDRKKQRGKRIPISVAIAAALALAASTMSAGTAQAAPADITVDLTTVKRAVPADTFSADVTGYGYHSYITNDPQVRAMLAGRYGSLRMGLKYAVPGDTTSAIVANGDGADTTVSGDAWVKAIKDVGSEPVVIVPVDAREAAAMVRHFNTGPAANRVGRWIVGNEPNTKPGTGDAGVYAAAFNSAYDAMKAVDPTITVGGPAMSDPNWDYLRPFLVASGSRVDFVDFHKYGAGERAACDNALLAATPQWGADVETVRAMIREIVPARADRIGIQVGETNSDWGIHPNPAGCDNIGTEPVQYRNAAIWWSASVFGHLANAGARGYAFGDKNGALSLLYDKANADRDPTLRNGAGLNERMPLYQGLGFFTGQEGTALSHFGTSLVQSSTTLPGVEVFASANPNVVILINKGTTAYNAVVSVKGNVTNVDGHRKDGSTISYAKPVPLARQQVVNGQVSVTLPGPSVTQLVLS
ncbi:GH39 family glycosyl hydrolase [Embleya sp. NBC_00896]|uniref:GH39 family glycosyl hydrolase n=1 Tax=Embleya sp. NBC_00896 TaxID=2975961 RepID=UPI002F909130|nr:hypothetical protein OG928_43780 [Embleya sp. NBC_00896]